MDKSLINLIRQLTKTDTKNLSQKALKAAEEVGELAKVVLPFENAFACRHRFADRTAILEEVADTILTVISIAYDLGFEDSEIDEMIKQKALYWGELQTRDREAKFPVPYEIHVTVKNANIEEFKKVCSELQVKPLLLDLQNQIGESVLQDVMTSSIHLGDNGTSYKELQRIVSGLTEKGFQVVRQKIETVPWHPAAPSNKHSNPMMPKDCYFESHLAIIATEESLSKLKDVVTRNDCHLSRNIFKRIDTDTFKIMCTYRRYDGVFETFKKTLETIKEDIIAAGFEVDKTIVEFSIYDTKVNHDASWLTN